MRAFQQSESQLIDSRGSDLDRRRGTGENAIAKFLGVGGHITRVDEAVTATEQDLVEYLANCGLPVKYVREGPSPYVCDKVHYTLAGLVKLANRYRIAQQLPPLVIQVPVRAKRQR
jgi:hypothetical protein